ncbi:TPA: ribose 5-phosphate isomerase B [bacterium]|jgi:ribose 5-phosphate isomerase B|nr:ribose 5-phosphate isomerase B [bacterium]
MIIALGSDHGGFDTKNLVVNYLKEKGYEVKDIGCNSTDSCDYPLFGLEVGEIVASKQADIGIVVCTTGVGISIAANKVKGIRCGLAWNPTIAKYCRMHNDCNVLALPGKYLSEEEIYEIVKAFLEAEFEGGRHQRRVDIINQYDRER